MCKKPYRHVSRKYFIIWNYFQVYLTMHDALLTVAWPKEHQPSHVFHELFDIHILATAGGSARDWMRGMLQALPLALLAVPIDAHNHSSNPSPPPPPFAEKLQPAEKVFHSSTEKLNAELLKWWRKNFSSISFNAQTTRYIIIIFSQAAMRCTWP